MAAEGTSTSAAQESSATSASEPHTVTLQAARAAVNRLDLFVKVASGGIRVAAGQPGLVKLLREVQPILGEPIEADDEFQESMRHAEEVAAFATGEIREGLPYLFGIAAVQLWSIIEALVDDVVTEAIELDQQCLAVEVVQRLNGPLVPFAMSPRAEQAEILCELLKEHVRAPLQVGIGKFDSMLKAVGLGGFVPDSVRRVLLELTEIRNSIVHNAGHVDDRLLERCPWLGCSEGAPVKVSCCQYMLFQAAAHWYVLEVWRRTRTQRGLNITDKQRDALEKLLNCLDLVHARTDAAN
jgi:hypothetical protein